MKRYQLSMFIFRRDLRLFDNLGLNAAMTCSQRVIAGFIFDPSQIRPHAYQSRPGLQFMREALVDLQRQLREHAGGLSLFQDSPAAVIKRLRREQGIEAVFVNRDYTPFSRQRDEQLRQCCQELGMDFHSCDDLLLTQPEQVLKQDGSPYQVFTKFHQRASQFPVAVPKSTATATILTVEGDKIEDRLVPMANNQSQFAGGRAAALERLRALGRCRDYDRQRDFPALSATSELSAHLKFGCCSVREVYYAVVRELGEQHSLLRQLYWRDFFSHIAWHFPQVFGHAFQARFDNIVWSRNQDHFWAWAEGRTGFPLVDAAMRELNATGRMHNRLRMVTASFLVKDLHISWRWGERYFAQHLLDYDPCLNNGNWQWAASTGCDAQPYFRIFNPWLQQQKFDPDALYIKRWLPELAGLPAKRLHRWYQAGDARIYPLPMIDHAEQSRRCKLLYQLKTEV